MRAVSKKRQRLKTPRSKVVAACHERSGNQCEARDLVPDVECWTPDGKLDCHEVIPKSVWPAGWLELDNTKSVCRAHHNWIDDHPDEAHTVGLHGKSWEVAS